MELLGLLLAFPVSAVLSGLYARFAYRVIAPQRSLARGIWAFSWLPVVIVGVQVVCVLRLGPLRAYHLLQPFFTAAAFLVFAVPPAVINLFALAPAKPSSRLAILGALLGFMLGVGAAFYNLQVGETLYGVDGSGGPLGEP